MMKDGENGRKVYLFFIDTAKYETDFPELTGAQIKAKVPNWDPVWGLLLEGHGNDPDRYIGDSDSVSLVSEHEGVHKFRHVPPATFGGHRSRS